MTEQIEQTEKARFLDSVGNTINRTFSSVFNSISGVGSESDIFRNIAINTNKRSLSSREAFSLYSTSGLMQRIIEKIPELAMEFDLKVEYTGDGLNNSTNNQPKRSSFDVTGLVEILNNLPLDEKTLDNRLKVDYKDLFYRASISARLFKESYVYLELDDGEEIDQPVNWERCNGLVSLSFFEFGELEPKFDKKNLTFYQMKIENSTLKTTAGNSYTTIKIHPSRILLFEGKKSTRKMRELNNNYALSTFNAVADSFTIFAGSINIIGNILSKMITLVFKFNKLREFLKIPGNDAVISNRVKLHAKGAGSIGGFMVDAETEDITWLTANVTGASEIVSKIERFMTANTDLPHDLLWNEGSAVTASDLEHTNTQRTIKSFIRNYWQDNLEYLIRAIACEFLPLEKNKFKITLQLPETIITLKEQMEALQTQATVDKTYIELGVYTPQAVGRRLKEENKITDSKNGIVKRFTNDGDEEGISQFTDAKLLDTKLIDANYSSELDYLLTQDSLVEILKRAKNNPIGNLVYAELDDLEDKE
jgi:hypothetical protein